jgi:hypothetical protein
MKQCILCNEQKELVDFGRDVYRPDGLNLYCKLCIRKRSKKQRDLAPEKGKIYATEYRKKNAQILRDKAKINYYLEWEKRREQAKKSYECHKLKIAEKRAKIRHTEEGRAKNRERQREWHKKNATKAGTISSNWKKRNPEKSAAHSLVCWAVKSGLIKREEKCQECGKECKTQAHHLDYAKPIDVQWICRVCHGEKHRIYR